MPLVPLPEKKYMLNGQQCIPHLLTFTELYLSQRNTTDSTLLAFAKSKSDVTADGKKELSDIYGHRNSVNTSRK